LSTQLEIKDYYSPDIDEIWSWKPKSSEDVNFLLEVNIGEYGEDASDIFQVTITTPKGLHSSQTSNALVLSDRACLVFKEYSWLNLLSRP